LVKSANKNIGKSPIVKVLFLADQSCTAQTAEYFGDELVPKLYFAEGEMGLDRNQKN